MNTSPAKAPASYAHALALLNGRASRNLPGKATKAIRLDDGSIAVRYHATNVLTFAPDGSVTVTSGGYRSKTTKDKINEWLPAGWARVWQANGVWSYDGKPLIDGDRLTAKGKLTRRAGRSAEATRIAALTKRINAHADKCAEAVPMALPSGGDDWYSALRTEDGRTLGEATANTSHLESNMDEGYIVPSLVLRALEATGAGDAIKAATFGQAGGYLVGLAKEQVRKAVRRYMKGRFGIAGGAFGRCTGGIHGAA